MKKFTSDTEISADKYFESSDILMSIERSDMANGIVVFAINRIDASDESGVAVSNTGDVNGYGLDDPIIGTHSAGPIGNRAGGS